MAVKKTEMAQNKRSRGDASMPRLHSRTKLKYYFKRMETTIFSNAGKKSFSIGA
jgi:hypothetical protein